MEYFHLVFTPHHWINPLAIGRPRLIYGLLFRCVADTLLVFARNPKWLGATPGILMLLHTWGQKLDLHIHLHCIVTGGGLTQALTQGEVHLPQEKTEPKTQDKSRTEAIGRFIDGCKKHDWVVYAKASFANPEEALQYVSRYTYKTAIGNERLIDQSEDRVPFHYRDYAHGNKTRVLALEPQEFIRRFLLHILPKRFVRIRGYGLLANRYRRKHLKKAREALGQFEAPAPEKSPESVAEFMLRVAGIDIGLCPRCHKGRMREVAHLPPVRGPPDAEAGLPGRYL